VFVIIEVGTADTEGHDRLEVVGTFETKRDAEMYAPMFGRATKRFEIKELISPYPTLH